MLQESPKDFCLYYRLARHAFQIELVYRRDKPQLGQQQLSINFYFE